MSDDMISTIAEQADALAALSQQLSEARAEIETVTIERNAAIKLARLNASSAKAAELALSARDAKPNTIPLTPAEIQSGLDRVRWAELLIRQLPDKHEGRNSWLLNYGIGSSPPEPNRQPIWTAPEATQHSFINEIGNRIKITIDGPTSVSENVLTPMEAKQLQTCLAIALSKRDAPQAQAVDGWRYEIQHGPEGETDYAWVYRGKEMICTTKTHHAIAIVSALTRPSTTEAKPVEALLREFAEQRHPLEMAPDERDGADWEGACAAFIEKSRAILSKEQRT